MLPHLKLWNRYLNQHLWVEAVHRSDETDFLCFHLVLLLRLPSSSLTLDEGLSSAT